VRSKFISQMPLGSVAIADIEFDVFCRHELVPILMALQYLYVERKETIAEICRLIEAEVNANESKRLGVPGLTYWEILVLAALRLGCDLDYDQLSDLASHHRKIRQMMGISDWDGRRYPRSTINDNLTVLSAKTLEAISQLVVAEGHRLCPEAVRSVRGDSYVLRKNIHYPTDANLVTDGIRKVIAVASQLANDCGVSGWRQHTHLGNKAHEIKRTIEKVAASRRKDKDSAMESCYRQLLDHCHMILERAVQTLHQFDVVKDQLCWSIERRCTQLASELQYFIGGTEYTAELARRRVIAGETIPHQDKVFSLFEPDTELINRGKKPQPIEFGHRVMLVQDSAGFIVHSQVMGHGITDEKILVEVMHNLQRRYNGKIRAASFDKGFWTPNNLQQLSKIINLVVLPKKGKRSAADSLREGAKDFGDVRCWHAGIESAINALQAGNGLDVCRDKGVDGYRRYLALGVLGRNLHTLGNIFVDKERARRRKGSLQLAS